MRTKRLDDSRRRFIRHGIDMGGALLATAAFSRTLKAAPIEPSDAVPANETLKTIHSLRTIHGAWTTRASMMPPRTWGIAPKAPTWSRS